MSVLSSYIDYLPSVLWSAESDEKQFLARWLCGFEKILTGITDDVPFADVPLEQIIDRLPHLFDPWRTQARFLPMLAAWVGLTIPEGWEQDEYRLRKLISEIVPIYEQRGLKRGLHTYLDIYAATAARPRIAIDDGEALFRVTILPDGAVRMHVLAHTHRALTDGDISNVALLHPSAVAVDADGSIIVADAGSNDTAEDVPPALWRVSRSGELPFAYDAGQTILRPVHNDSVLKTPTSIVIDEKGGFNVLDIGDRGAENPIPAIHRFTQDGYDKTLIEGSSFKAVHPVDMILDRQGRLVVLDRGKHPSGFPPEGPAQTRVVIVDTVSSDKPSAEDHDLRQIVEPTAIVMDMEGYYIIADAGNQKDKEPANLLSVDPIRWEITPLLKKNNPLIFPTGLAFMNSTTLIVCDTGLRWGTGTEEGVDRSNRALAEPASLYRVDLSASPPTVVPLLRMPGLVNPCKIACVGTNTLIVADYGESYRREGQETEEWRTKPHQFGVVVHFSQQRPTKPTDRNRMRREIEAIVDQHRPGHTKFWMEI
jgi:phage tail-like protein